MTAFDYPHIYIPANSDSKRQITRWEKPGELNGGFILTLMVGSISNWLLWSPGPYFIHLWDSGLPFCQDLSNRQGSVVQFRHSDLW